MVVRLVVELPQHLLGEEGLRQLNDAAICTGTKSFVLTARCASLSICSLPSSPTPSATGGNEGEHTRWAGFFLSPTVTESAMHDFKARDFALFDEQLTTQISRRLLAMVHPFLAANFAIRGIVSIQNVAHCPADIILLDVSHAPVEVLDHMLQTTNGQTIHSGPDGILKCLLISEITFRTKSDIKSPKYAVSAASSAQPPRTSFDIPSCPVCLHRIDPTRLGLPPPPNNQLCSKFCPPPNLIYPTHEENSSCPQQRLLRPWPRPCRCSACSMIDRYWKTELQALSHESHEHLSCFRCELEETLWVCLTCGFVGCGRYSNRHSVEHFDETGHPFSLELATLRIWDYATGYFSHRTDLLDCPSSPPLLFPWARVQHGNGGHSTGQWGGLDEMKSPKKASMIGEEYETLLQSALEEQAQHYEGEITRLRSKLAEDSCDMNTMSAQEADEIRVLQAEIASLRSEIMRCSHELLEWQDQEATNRAQSHSLLEEQKIVQDLLSTIKEETAREHAEGTFQMEELEQQIADLTANQNMRRQFSQDEELQQAQIWGMSSESAPRGRKKKAKRSFRK
ncbi:hypothetical protein ACA910_012749 [Epithemia clementina (nom. ined.)]